MQIHTVDSIPEDLSFNNKAIYILPAAKRDDAWYAARTDRNIGWITQQEQDTLRKTTAGMAGVGGMGGGVSELLHRYGVGHLKLAELDTYDISNINRQPGAIKSTVGVPKIKVMSKNLLDISDDVDLTLYPAGLNAENIPHFVSQCDIILDGIDLWSIGARILLHQEARKQGVPIINVSGVGYTTHLFLFEPGGKTIESCLGMSCEEALDIEEKFRTKTLTQAERIHFLSRVILGLMPEIPSYADKNQPAGNIHTIRKIMMEKTGAPSNGPLAWLSCCFAAHHIALYLLKDSGVKRNIVKIPHAPGYMKLDMAHMHARVCKGGFFNLLKRHTILWLIKKKIPKSA